MYRISHTSYDSENFKNFDDFEIPVIDVAATSKNLKKLRVERKLKVSDLQNLFGFENPQAIYSWENETCKILPRIDNLVTLAKLYNVQIDELVVLKNETQSSENILKEDSVPFGIEQQTLDFVKQNASSKTIKALERFYSLKCGEII